MTNLRKLARGQECMVRAPGCNYDPETTVLAHLNGAGMGRKDDDLFGAWCCNACHNLVDGAVKTEYANTTIELWHYQGVIRTQRELLRLGVLKTG